MTAFSSWTSRRGVVVLGVRCRMWKKPVGEEEDGKEERGNRKGRERE
jgi:hypothetical protein